MRNQKGFFHILMIILLPVVLAALFSVQMIIGFVHLQSEARQQCRTVLLLSQNKSIPPLRILMSLNIKARALQAQLYEALAELASATATGNVGWMSKAAAQVEHIHNMQRALASNQKSLINWANSELSTNLYKAQHNVSQTIHNYRQAGVPLIDLNHISVSTLPTQLAVEALNPDSLAPEYKLKENFEDAQTHALHWSYHYQNNSWLQHFVNLDFQFKDSCAATLEPEGPQKWIANLRADKS